MKTHQEYKIDFINNNFTIIDNNSNVIYQHTDWENIVDYADNQDLNIVYYAKDLIFSFVENENNTEDIFLNIKYGGGHDNLGSHNIRGLPVYISPIESMECHFPLIKKVSKNKIIKDMLNLGADFNGSADEVLKSNNSKTSNKISISQIGKKIELIDENGTKLYEHSKWEKIEIYAEENNLKIIFNPQDLLYRFSDDNTKLILELKYGDIESSTNELTQKNIKGLPNFIFKDGYDGEFNLKEWVKNPTIKNKTKEKLENLGFSKNPNEHSTDYYHKNVKIELENDVISLVDKNNKVVFKNSSWDKVKEFEQTKNYKIVFYPKDLKFNIVDEKFIILEVKYGTYNNELNENKNLRDIPFYITHQNGIFKTNENNKSIIIKDMLEAGAEFDGNLQKSIQTSYKSKKF